MNVSDCDLEIRPQSEQNVAAECIVVFGLASVQVLEVQTQLAIFSNPENIFFDPWAAISRGHSAYAFGENLLCLWFFFTQLSIAMVEAASREGNSFFDLCTFANSETRTGSNQ